MTDWRRHREEEVWQIVEAASTLADTGPRALAPQLGPILGWAREREEQGPTSPPAPANSNHRLDPMNLRRS
jgi:hypothetical protein